MLKAEILTTEDTKYRGKEKKRKKLGTGRECVWVCGCVGVWGKRKAEN
jgi:hypothetical protein